MNVSHSPPPFSFVLLVFFVDLDVFGLRARRYTFYFSKKTVRLCSSEQLACYFGATFPTKVGWFELKTPLIC